MSNLAMLTDRFWSKVRKTDVCWEWTGSLTKDGYGQIGLRSKVLYTHRVAWELRNGPIPAGLHVCHNCDNPSCVRPDHLFLGTQADNVRDMVSKGRQNSPRLAEPTRKEILARRAAGETLISIALACGVHENTVARAVRRDAREKKARSA